MEEPGIVPAPGAASTVPALVADNETDDDDDDDDAPLRTSSPNYTKTVWNIDYREALR